jgi:hypothetical protein
MAEIITSKRARAIAHSGAAHLADLVGADGRFVYRYMLPDPSIRDGVYSNVRHLGALWAMLDWEREAGCTDVLAAAIERVAGYAASAIFVPFGATDELCVLDEGVIKLGGPALGISASCALYRRSADPDQLDRALRLGRYVARQRRADGDFVHIVIPGRIAREHPTRADMLTGQAVLALALLGETSGDASWTELARDSAMKLERQNHGVASGSHWMLYALEALHAVQPQQWLLDYAQRIAAAIAAPRWSSVSHSTPIACATEGLLAFARMSPPGAPARAEALKVIRRNLRHQLRFHDRGGAFVRSLDMPEVRIDYIMHNVIGFLGFARLEADLDRRAAE